MAVQLNAKVYSVALFMCFACLKPVSGTFSMTGIFFVGPMRPMLGSVFQHSKTTLLLACCHTLSPALWTTCVITSREYNGRCCDTGFGVVQWFINNNADWYVALGCYNHNRIKRDDLVITQYKSPIVLSRGNEYGFTLQISLTLSQWQASISNSSRK